MAWEVTPSSFCQTRLSHLDTASYRVSAFQPTRYIADGYKIDLGGRHLEVIAVPGHTPDAICLFEKSTGYLWSGDSFYEGPIFLFDPVTDLEAYKKSINTMAKLALVSTRVLPAHNLPVASPSLVIKAARDFNQIAAGARKGGSDGSGTVLFECGAYSYRVGETQLEHFLRHK